MAGIDKIYLTVGQYYDFEQWIYRNTFWVILFTWKNPCRYLYGLPKEAYSIGFEQKEYSASNFPTVIDRFLFVFCELPCIQKRLREQYGSIWKCVVPYSIYKLIK